MDEKKCSCNDGKVTPFPLGSLIEQVTYTPPWWEKALPTSGVLFTVAAIVFIGLSAAGLGIGFTRAGAWAITMALGCGFFHRALG